MISHATNAIHAPFVFWMKESTKNQLGKKIWHIMHVYANCKYTFDGLHIILVPPWWSALIAIERVKNGRIWDSIASRANHFPHCHPLFTISFFSFIVTFYVSYRNECRNVLQTSLLKGMYSNCLLLWNQSGVRRLLNLFFRLCSQCFLYPYPFFGYSVSSHQHNTPKRTLLVSYLLGR